MRSMSDILQQVDEVLLAVDEYCASGEMLALSRSAQQMTFQTWVTGEIRRQMDGEDPVPWPGPFA